jgi:outer membrane receptor for ferric coprogen and ferric-rhodotorulic acid
VSAVFAVSLSAQQAAPPSSSSPGSANPEEVFELDVFHVSAAADTGYTSEQAMNATRTNEKLENLPNSISVMTKEFMDDFLVQDMFEAVEFAVNAENIYNSQGTVGAPIESRGGNQISFRGFPVRGNCAMDSPGICRSIIQHRSDRVFARSRWASLWRRRSGWHH